MNKFYLFIVMLFMLGACSREEKSIPIDKENFLIVNMNHNFPIIDLSNLHYDSLGLTCEKCFDGDKEKVYLYSVIIDKDKRGISYEPSGWTASYYFTYDTNGRINRQVVSSCFNWRISYKYSDTLGSIYQYSKIDKEQDIDTTIYKLDPQGRVSQINGVEYGDLFKRKFLKKIFYSKVNSIPDSIHSTFRRGKKQDEIRKQIYYQNNNTIDSVKIESTRFEDYGSMKYELTNYFDKKGIFYAQRIINSKYLIDSFYVERLTYSKVTEDE